MCWCSCCVRVEEGLVVSGSFDGVGRDCRDMIIDAHSRVLVVLVMVFFCFICFVECAGCDCRGMIMVVVTLGN